MTLSRQKLPFGVSNLPYEAILISFMLYSLDRKSVIVSKLYSANNVSSRQRLLKRNYCL